MIKLIYDYICVLKRKHDKNSKYENRYFRMQGGVPPAASLHRARGSGRPDRQPGRARLLHRTGICRPSSQCGGRSCQTFSQHLQGGARHLGGDEDSGTIARHRGETRKYNHRFAPARCLQERHLQTLSEEAQERTRTVGRHRGLQGDIQEFPYGPRREIARDDTARRHRPLRRRDACHTLAHGSLGAQPEQF